MSLVRALKLTAAIGWLCAQAALILSADARPERAFGFRMFPESSTISYSLSRVVVRDGVRQELRVHDGHYTVPQPDGSLRHYDWRAWITTPSLGRFDRELGASYGVEAQLARLSWALESFARTIDDGETEAFVLTGTTRKNGGEATPFSFERKAGTR